MFTTPLYCTSALYTFSHTMSGGGWDWDGPYKAEIPAEEGGAPDVDISLWWGGAG